MTTLLDKKAGELDELVAIVHEIQDKAAKEERDLTDVERDRIAALGEAATKLRADCEFLNDQVVSERAWSTLRHQIELNKGDEDTDRLRTASRTIAPQGGLETRGWGEAFTDSDAFQNYPGGGTSQRVTVPFDLERRAAITTTTVPQIPYLYTPPSYTYASPLLDVCGKVTTSGNAVSWVQWTPNPQAAAPLVLEGDVKTEAAMTATPQTGSLATYAHWKGITRQTLEDSPQVRSIVEGRLRQGVTVALETAVVAALVAAVIPPVTGSAAGGDSLLTAIRGGIAQVQAAGFAKPNAIVVNPADAADFDVAMMAGTLGGAVVNGSYWGLPIIPDKNVAVGTAYVGDFGMGVQLFNRGTTDLYMTDSHADYFVRNILLLLAETRALATVPEPQALAECTVGA